MSFQALSLAALSTAAAGAVSATLQTLERGGSAFASMLTSEVNEPASPAHGQPQSIQQRLTEWADTFRQWLGEHGVSDPFDVTLQVDQFGYSQMAFGGPAGDEVQGLLDQHPAWRQQLERLASSMQAATADLFSSAVELRVDAADSQSRWLSSGELTQP